MPWRLMEDPAIRRANIARLQDMLKQGISDNQKRFAIEKLLAELEATLRQDQSSNKSI